MPVRAELEEITQALGIPKKPRSRKAPGERELTQWVSEQGVAFKIDGDSGSKSFLARFLVGYALGSSALLYIHENGIWPSSELPGLFDRVRASQGFPHLLHECRGERVGPEEEEYLECLVACGLYFVWGFFLFNPDTKLIFLVSHDEYFIVAGVDREKVAEVANSLRECNFEPLG
ncbi:MAG: hypothetical protein ACO1SV_19085 [Fimbriimonas sp.]